VRVEIVAMAALREALGGGRVSVDVPPGAAASQVRARLADLHPRWRELILACRMARGVEFLDESVPLCEGEEIVFLPPVSGGSGPPPVLLTEAPLEVDRLRREAHARHAGAVVVFEGTARSPSRGREVEYLHYEAYAEMATAIMERIVEEVRARWPVAAVFLHHRLGRIEIGEVSVVAVASAPHRAQAFEACRHLIEGLKADVPIWKREVLADGGTWVGAPGECAGE
jgi:molybdopterin synthase catalytic subunit